MPLQLHLDETYMQCAELHAKLSKAKRAQVGAVLVTKSGIIIPGYNGTPNGHDNDCETHVLHTTELVTKPTVIHAELNCILKAAKEGVSVVGATCYVTLMPCVQCSAMLCQAGIARLVYKEEYRCRDGIEVLQESNVKVDKYENH